MVLSSVEHGGSVEGDALKLGLLADAVQGQQTLADRALEQLRAHTSGLDEIVRDVIRQTLLEELQTLADDSQRARVALQRLQHATGVRLLAYGLALAVPGSVLPVALVWHALPSYAEVSALTAQRAGLAEEIARLTREGGRTELRHCGAARRLCVQIDGSAPSYGAGGEFRVVKGY
jgi:hypothetical protein